MFKQVKHSLFFSIASFLPNYTYIEKFVYILYRCAGVKIHGRSRISRPLTIRPFGACSNVHIGKGSFLNINVRFAVPAASVRIGENCQIASNVSFETVSHGLLFEAGKGRGSFGKDITVGDRTWIATGAIILQGVSIGHDSIVAAGAVVNKDVPPFSVVAGVPARVVKKLDKPTQSEVIK